ncbi:T9SS type A sorting domain-containing protein [candidate division WOR-3 bacterium]|nr:T9SS type A sorting domain-containing protein [candidate division WOR-3 bacterium]
MTKKVMGIAVAVLILAVAVPVLNAQPTMLVDEDFNSTWVPSGWEVIVYNSGTNFGIPCYWSQYYYGSPYDNGPYAGYVWWSNSYQNEWLITPPLDLTSVEAGGEVLFGFNSCFYHTDATHNYVCVGILSPTKALMPQHIWIDTLVDLNSDFGYGNFFTMINDYPNPFEIDISEYAGQVIYLGFNYYWMGGGGGARGILNVDDVWVSAEEGGGPGPGEDTLDLEIMQVIRPNEQEEGGTAFTPGVRIKNNLDTVANAEVRCRIKDLGSLSTVYEDVLHSYPLDPGISEVSAFRKFTPDINMTYEAFFVVQHPDDPHSENNDITKRFTTAGIRLNPVTMLSPSPTQYNSFSPSATFQEMAGQPTVVANLICTIEDLTYNAIVYTDTLKSESFTAGESRDVTFSPVTSLAFGTYQITFKAFHLLEGDISNPELVETFDYVGIGEVPVVATFSLNAVGNKVRFSLAEDSDVTLKLYDVAGKVVASLASGSYSAGIHTLTFEKPTSGVYFVRLVTPTFNAVEKVTVLK